MRVGILFLLFLASCSWQKPEVIEVSSCPVLIHPNLPEPVNLEAPKFYVLTKDNIDSLIEKEGVIFAVNTDGYETLSINVQELRRYIMELQNVVIYYKTSIDKSKGNNNGSR